MLPERVLIRSVNWLGDAVMTTPALLRLREARPAAHVTLLTHRKLAGLWAHHPAVDAVKTFEDGENVFGLGRRLRAQRFDVALVLPNSPRSALEMFLAGIPQRIGYARPWRNWFLTRRIAPSTHAVEMRKRSARAVRRAIATSPRPAAQIPSAAHHVYRYMPLVAALGANPEPVPPHIAVTEAEVRAVHDRFGFPADGSSRTMLFGLNAGAAYGPAKRWPRERFIAAAKGLMQRIACRCWVFGAEADEADAASIARELATPAPGGSAAARCLAGRTSLRELCAALKACDVVLTNDSGPMHLAAAVGTPVVALFGSTSPELTGPGLPGTTHHVVVRAPVPCAPCFRRECPIDFRCMTGISVEQVVEAVLGAGAAAGRSRAAERLAGGA